MPDDYDFSIEPGTGVYVWHNAAGGISMIPADADPEPSVIALSHEEALRLARWLQGECSARLEAEE